MFNKTTWMIGILTTVFVAGSTVAFWTLYQNVLQTTESAKTSIARTAQEVGTEITRKALSELNIKEITSQIQAAAIEDATASIKEEVNKSIGSATAKVALLSSQIEDQGRAVDALSSSLATLYRIQAISKESEVSVSYLGSSPTIKKIGASAVVNFTLRAPYLESSSLLNVMAVVVFQGRKYKVQDILIKGSAYVRKDVPILIGRSSIVDGKVVDSGPGEYAIECRVYSSDERLLLAQDSATMEVFGP